MLLYKSMVKSDLDYCSYRKGGIESLEKVLRATKMITSLKHITYSEQLKACNLTTLHYGRIRGDMIETYKIITGKYDTDVAPTLVRAGTNITRGNELHLLKVRQNMT